jgi:hypothetical protein
MIDPFLFAWSAGGEPAGLAFRWDAAGRTAVGGSSQSRSLWSDDKPDGISGWRRPGGGRVAVKLDTPKGSVRGDVLGAAMRSGGHEPGVMAGTGLLPCSSKPTHATENRTRDARTMSIIDQTLGDDELYLSERQLLFRGMDPMQLPSMNPVVSDGTEMDLSLYL